MGKTPKYNWVETFHQSFGRKPCPSKYSTLPFSSFISVWSSGFARLARLDFIQPPGCGGICNQTGSAGWQKDVGWLDPPGEVNRLRKFTGGYCPPSLLQTQKSGETAVKKGPEIKFRKCAPGSPFSANFRQAQHQNKQTSRVKAKKVAGLKTAAVRMKKKRAKRTITLCLNYFRGTPF